MSEEVADSIRLSAEKHKELPLERRVYNVLCDAFAKHARSDADSAFLRLAGSAGVYSLWEQFGKNVMSVDTGTSMLEKLEGVDPAIGKSSDGAFVLGAVREALGANTDLLAPFAFQISILQSPDEKILPADTILTIEPMQTDDQSGSAEYDLQTFMYRRGGFYEELPIPENLFQTIATDLGIE